MCNVLKESTFGFATHESAIFEQFAELLSCTVAVTARLATDIRTPNDETRSNSRISKRHSKIDDFADALFATQITNMAEYTVGAIGLEWQCQKRFVDQAGVADDQGLGNLWDHAFQLFAHGRRQHYVVRLRSGHASKHDHPECTFADIAIRVMV